MAVIGDLSEAQLATMTNRVGARLGEESTSMRAPAATTVTEIAGSAVQFIRDVAPRTPDSIAREAAIRLGGWLLDNRPHLAEHVVKDPSGTEYTLKFANHAATANGFRHSGASALVSRFIRRRGGVIGGPAAGVVVAEPDPDIGTTVMRCGFATPLPFTDNVFRWIGTANGVELDTSWSQPAAFGFWLPGDLMSRVVEVVLLRSIQTGGRPDTVNLAAFEPAISYQFGDTPGMLRHTAITFDGNFSLPNDFRAVLGELR